MIFLIMILVILAFVVMWNFDVHKIIHTKAVTQNAGDAAALVAGRWQGITLNLIGELNVMQAMALATGDQAAVDAITNIQARLSYTGPMIAFMAAQQAAKNNGIHVNPGFTRRLREHADKVRYEYTTTIGPGGTMLFPEPWPGAWAEYAEMLDTVADNGVAAAPDNARMYTDYSEGHPLVDIGFYEAIAGQGWCWFYHNYRNYNVAPVHPPVTLLESYHNFHPCWWPDLPLVWHHNYINSEIFGLGLSKVNTTLGAAVDDMVAAGLPDPAGGRSMVTNAAWYTYDSEYWSAWNAISPDGPDHFPVVGHVRPQYDYTGADAVTRIEAGITRLTPGAGGSTVSNRITWTAASKPFGYLNDEDRPDAFGMVLPAFHDVRLIPLGASSAPSGGAYNLGWRAHIEEHLPGYLDNGPSALVRECWYCRQLDTDTLSWENAAFRQGGLDWLSIPANVQTCLTGTGGGGGPGGGTRYAH